MAMSKTEALLQLIDTVYQMIKLKGPDGMPDGHLYVMLQSKMGERWTLSFHQQVIGLLVDAGKITNKNHLLIAK